MNTRKKGIILTLYLLLGINALIGQNRIIPVEQNTIDDIHDFFNDYTGMNAGYSLSTDTGLIIAWNVSENDSRATPGQESILLY